MFFIYSNIEQKLTQNIASRVDIQIKIDTLTISSDMSSSKVNISFKIFGLIKCDKKKYNKISLVLVEFLNHRAQWHIFKHVYCFSLHYFSVRNR